MDVFCLNKQRSLTCDLYFEADFDDFEIKTFQIVKANVSDEILPIEDVKGRFLKSGDLFEVYFKTENEFELKVCDSKTELNSSARDSNCLRDVIKFEYLYYSGKNSSSHPKESGSGPNYFNPTKNTPTPYGSIRTSRVFPGKRLTIVQVIF